jgi:hypothetical protein
MLQTVHCQVREALDCARQGAADALHVVLVAAGDEGQKGRSGALETFSAALYIKSERRELMGGGGLEVLLKHNKSTNSISNAN